MTAEEQLRVLRAEIAEIDSQIFNLVTCRLTMSKKIGELKRDNFLPVHNPAEELNKLKWVEKISAERGINNHFAISLMELLMGESRRIQHEEQ